MIVPFRIFYKFAPINLTRYPFHTIVPGLLNTWFYYSETVLSETIKAIAIINIIIKGQPHPASGNVQACRSGGIRKCAVAVTVRQVA